MRLGRHARFDPVVLSANSGILRTRDLESLHVRHRPEPDGVQLDQQGQLAQQVRIARYQDRQDQLVRQVLKDRKVTQVLLALQDHKDQREQLEYPVQLVQMLGL